MPIAICLAVHLLLSTSMDSLAKREIQDAGGEMKPYSEKIPGTDLVIDWVAIPAGESGFPETVTVGSPPAESGRLEDEGPTFEVTIEPFWMMKCEVTWDVFNQFRKEYSQLQDSRIPGDEIKTPAWIDAVSIPTPLWEQDAAPILQGLGTSDGFPAADITQFAAMQFSKWLTFKTGKFTRLPSEAEWEYAARAGSDSPWFFGESEEKLEEYAWFFDNSAYDDPDAGYPGLGAGYRKVGSLKPNPWGLHDIYGNVAEWVLDGYSKESYQKHGGKKVSWLDAIDWPEKIFPTVVRGGSWQSDPQQCRSASRETSHRKWQKKDPQIPRSIWWCTDAFHVGFRLVRPLETPDPKEQPRFWMPRVKGIKQVLEEGYKELRAPIERGSDADSD